jgi:hypothetical protein
MKHRRKIRAALIAAAILIAGGGYWAYHGYVGKSMALNDDVVEPGKLIRTAQPRPGDLAEIKAKYGLATIVCLRGKEPYEVSMWARRNNVRVIMLKMWADDPPTPDQAGIFFDLMRGDTITPAAYGDAVFRVIGADPNVPTRFGFPILIHCEGGADRTGVMVALYRLAFQHWTLEQAQSEMKSHRHLPPAHPAQFKFLESIAPTITPYYGSKTHTADKPLPK